MQTHSFSRGFLGYFLVSDVLRLFVLFVVSLLALLQGLAQDLSPPLKPFLTDLFSLFPFVEMDWFFSLGLFSFVSSGERMDFLPFLSLLFIYLARPAFKDPYLLCLEAL